MRAPVEILNPDGRSPVVLLCEHASNHIPAHYKNLGLPASELKRHIAYDIGAAELTRALSQALDAPAFLAGYSRLLIDLNRPLHVAASIATRSEDIDIPGNIGLDSTERETRAKRIFHPFHDAVAALLDRRQASNQQTRIACIHSFTPVFLQASRPWHAGVLFDRAEVWGREVLRSLIQDGLCVDANVPYGVGPDDDYALPVHGDAREFDAILIEVRNDGLETQAGAKQWCEYLRTALMTNLRGSGLNAFSHT